MSTDTCILRLLIKFNDNVGENVSEDIKQIQHLHVIGGQIYFKIIYIYIFDLYGPLALKKGKSFSIHSE